MGFRVLKPEDEETIGKPAVGQKVGGFRVTDNSVTEPEEQPTAQAPTEPEPERKGYLSQLGEFVTKDIPAAATGVKERTLGRMQRIDAPTDLGNMTGAKLGGVVEQVASTPERLTRTVAGGFGMAAEPVAVASELAVKGANRLLGGIPASLAKMGVKKLSEIPGNMQKEEMGRTIEKVTSWWNGLDDAAKANYGSIPDILDMIGVGGIKVAKGAAKPGLSGLLKNAISKFSEIPEEALDLAANKKTLGTVSKAMKATEGDLFSVSKKLESTLAGKRVAMDDLAQGVESLKKADLEKELLKGKKTPFFSSSEAGTEIKDIATAAKKGAGERFEKTQSYIMDKKKGHGLNAGQISTEGRGGKNILQNEVDGFLKRIQYDETKGFGKVGGRVIPKEAALEIQSMYKQLGTAKNLEDALYMRRLVDQKINFGRDGKRLFERGSDSDWALTEVRTKFNDAIEKKMKESLLGESLVEAWRINNKQYSQVADALSDVEKSLSMGKTSSESYIRKIENIGIDKLSKMAALSDQDDIVKPVFKELKRGFYDNVLYSSTDANGINYDKFFKNWNSIDPKLKNIMVDAQDIKNVEMALQKYKPENIKPSTFGEGVFGKTLDADKMTRTLENIGSKAHREDLIQLRMLDDLLGNKGDARISDLAEKVYLGKQLKMTGQGKMPIVSDIRTGKFWAGMGAASSAGAAAGSAGGPVGAAVGSIAGALSGLYLQSPSAALTAYKTLNKLGILKEGVKDLSSGTITALTKIRPTAISKGVFRGLNQDDDEEKYKYKSPLDRFKR